MKHGTEWTEPGKGATLLAIQEPLKRYFWRKLKGGRRNPETGRALSAFLEPIETRIAASVCIGDVAYHDGICPCPAPWAIRTNLVLTGEPLTADDLKCIERAEVS